MGKVFSIAALVVVGVIIADVLIHPAGTQAATNGFIGAQNSAVSGLLGFAPSSGANQSAVKY